MVNQPEFYPRLSSVSDLHDGTRQRICIVTPDLLGADKNGGIGTACGYLALALADAGHDTSILYCHTEAENKNRDWNASYADRGVKVVSLEDWTSTRPARQIFPGLSYLRNSHAVYDWLCEQPEFDLILFMDWQGTGFYAMHARACGRKFKNTALGVIIHSPSYWHSINNGAIINTPLEACLWHMERKAMEMADFVISPSQYMLKWCGDRLCRLPAQAWVQPNLLEWDRHFANTHEENIEEIVFFGRLELRKGLEQFCSAVDRLAAKGQLPKKVTFLGKCAWLGEEHSAFYIARRAKNWPGCEVALETQKNHQQAVQYLCQKGRLAIMPSIADNSPYTVYECLDAGIPFLARDTGGISELMLAEDQDSLLFGDNPGELAAKIASALGKPPKRGTLAVNGEQNARAWRNGLPYAARLARSLGVKTVAPLPFISVVLTHYNRPALLEQALDSLHAQSYQNFEVILVDDGSTDPEAIVFLASQEEVFRQKGWRIIRLNNVFAPAARNQGVRAAKGEWVLFFDDDNIARPDMLKICAEAAANRHEGAVALMFQVFEGNSSPDEENLQEIFLPTGDALAYSTIHNTLADTTALIHKDTFWNVGGFREDYGIGHEDFELFVRLGLSGAPMTILPEPLFYYRRSAVKSSIQLNTNPALNRMRSLRPYLEMLPAPLAEIALMTHSMAHRLNLFPTQDINNEMEKGIEPDSARAMLQAAYLLSNMGSEDLAASILQTLPNADKSVQAGVLAARAGAAARSGNLEAIADYRKQLEALGLEDEDKAPFYKLILRNLVEPASELRSSILSCLEKMEKKSLLVCLLISHEVAELGNMTKALQLLLAALLLADQKYLEIRPDVATAVQDGVFLCGLQHFSLHGKTDKTPWPEHELFADMLERYPEIGKQLAVLHMQAAGYRDINLALSLLDSLVQAGQNQNTFT